MCAYRPLYVVLPLVALVLEFTPGKATANDLLTFHRPTYFATGFASDTQVKFQFSVKYDLWPNESGHAAYFAYSQKSLWNIFDKSAPFAENNYAPESFYEYRDTRWNDVDESGCGFLAYRLGAEHESNGESGHLSRAWNRLYAGGQFVCVSRSRSFLSWGLDLWLPFGLKDNPDIADYLGYGDVAVHAGTPSTARWYGRGEVSATFRKGVARKGSVLLEARWFPGYGTGPSRSWRFTPYLYGQLFGGYGETLLSYDRARTRFRIGLGFDDRVLLPNSN